MKGLKCNIHTTEKGVLLTFKSLGVSCICTNVSPSTRTQIAFIAHSFSRTSPISISFSHSGKQPLDTILLRMLGLFARFATAAKQEIIGLRNHCKAITDIEQKIYSMSFWPFNLVTNFHEIQRKYSLCMEWKTVKVTEAQYKITLTKIILLTDGYFICMVAAAGLMRILVVHCLSEVPYQKLHLEVIAASVVCLLCISVRCDVRFCHHSIHDYSMQIVGLCISFK